MSHGLALQHRTLESYFFEEIEHVQERLGRALAPEVEAYVVQLLATYARRTHAAGRRSRALALEYMRAKGEQGKARATALRRVGDRALYISGVAPKSLHRSPINVGYVQGIGRSAYREVAGSGALEVLGMIADTFEEVANTIGEVIELGPHQPAQHLWTLVERWRCSQDPRDAKELLETGILIDKKADILQ